MGLFARKKQGTSPKKVLHIERELPSREEAVRFMHDEGLPSGTMETMYSSDGEKRCVIFRSEKGFMTFCFERLRFLTEEEYRHSAVPARWEPMAGTRAKPVYTSLRDLKKQLACEPEYKTHFALSRA